MNFLRSFVSFVLFFSLAFTLPILSCADTAECDSSDITSEEVSDFAEWDSLESLGKIECENGIFFVSITMPAEYCEGATQESLDANKGGNYQSAMLNEDGSITYKLTKEQHKVMCNGIVASLEDSFREMIASPDYSYTKIEHNNDFSLYNITLSSKELGFTESFMTLAFYMYGGIYSIFTGVTPDNIAVNYYDPSGNLICTANSSEMG